VLLQVCNNNDDVISCDKMLCVLPTSLCVLEAAFLFQNKIKDLEEKLEDERRSRLVMQNKAIKVYRRLAFTALLNYNH